MIFAPNLQFPFDYNAMKEHDISDIYLYSTNTTKQMNKDEKKLKCHKNVIARIRDLKIMTIIMDLYSALLSCEYVQRRFTMR